MHSQIIYYDNALHYVSITRPPRFPDQDRHILVQNCKFFSAKATHVLNNFTFVTTTIRLDERVHTHKENAIAQWITSLANRTESYKINFSTNSCLNSICRCLIKILALSKKKPREKNQSQDKIKHSIYETFRLKLKSLSYLKHKIDDDFSLSRNVS